MYCVSLIVNWNTINKNQSYINEKLLKYLSIINRNKQLNILLVCGTFSYGKNLKLFNVDYGNHSCVVYHVPVSLCPRSLSNGEIKVFNHAREIKIKYLILNGKHV